MKTQFEVSGFNINKDQSYDYNTVSRIRNGLVRAIRDQKVLPKFIVMVYDDNILQYAKNKGGTSSTVFERLLKWLICQCDRLISTQKEYLPIKAKKVNEPYFIWIQPLVHRNFKNNQLREKFAVCLEKTATYHENTFALPLKKVWDENDSALFSATDNKFTANSYISYWEAVDQTVRYADTLLLKKESSTKNKSKVGQRESSEPKYFKSANKFDKHHWKSTTWKRR